ncbi:MAG: MFS transporter, partial [Hyphomonas sp.]|nr:MFS transporter [Hyphomonas sp.]
MGSDTQANALAATVAKPAGRTYVLLLLTLVYTFNHIDRQILVILLEPIKADLKLDDAQLGWLTGLVFAVFYATLGVPIAMWADRGNRRNIIVLALVIWSGMTALSGLAHQYWQLLLARMGVGVGEAGGTPPATSIISDLYAPKERATALGVYTTGIGLGILAGFILGGFVYEAFGWRAAFFVAGIPGLLLAMLVRFTLKEPARGAVETRTDVGEAPPIPETLRFILGQTSYLFLLAGCCLICISSNAFLVFTS